MVKQRDKSTPDAPPDDSGAVKAAIKDLRERSLRALGLLLDRCEARADALGAQAFDRDLCIATGQLAKTVVSLEAEQRQAERAARAAMQDASLPRMLSWLRQATPAERRAIARELGEINQGGGVLG